MQNIHSSNYKIGILGGGQLGRMTLQEAYNLNLHISVLDPSPNAPCKDLAHEFVIGDFKDFDTVYQFGKSKNLVTIEFEDVNADALEQLEKEGVRVYPQPAILKLIQDKGKQKEFYTKNKFPTSPFEMIHSKNEISKSKLEFPIFQKLRTSGYDGYGVKKITSPTDSSDAFDGPSVLESGVKIKKEISVIVARNPSGECSYFPPVELEFNPIANMVEFLISPAQIEKNIHDTACKLAVDLANKLGIIGLLAVEMFLDENDQVLINEIAPRSHNSGHQSIEGNFTSQFAQHLRAILDLPLGNTAIIMPSVMINLLGEEGSNGIANYQGLKDILKLPGVYPHLYGKEMVKSFRKMGHVTVINPNMEKAKELARTIKKNIKVNSI